ncbi:MAG: hypothetical protein P1U54_06285 [Immundisolibacteraceae bacterium]|nr:hypothetical protein [Immundisolibacteraceae bacterium]
MKVSRKFWSYYFFCYSAFLLLGTFSTIGSSAGGLADLSFIFSFLISVIGWLGLYGFLYSKRYFVKRFWAVFFAFEITGFAVGIAYPMIHLLYESLSLGLDQIFFAILIVCFVFCLSGPILFAHYKYTFTSQWNINSA